MDAPAGIAPVSLYMDFVDPADASRLRALPVRGGVNRPIPNLTREPSIHGSYRRQPSPWFP